MDITDRIAFKEKQINLLYIIIRQAKELHLSPKYIQEHRDKIKRLEESIEEDRKIQLAEAQASGRKT